MKVRHPPGRAGRPWLTHRLDVAYRGADLLDDKHRALLRERTRLRSEAADARERWERLAREAERWLARAAILGGERGLALAASGSPDAATLMLRRRTILGVTCPAEPRLELAEPAWPPAGESAALIEARSAHRRAVEAAVHAAVAERALALVEADLRATARRRNAIRRRWIPAHERALAALAAALEEIEREDGARVRSILARENRGAVRGSRQ